MKFSKRLLINILILAILLLIAFFVLNSKIVVKAQNQVKIFPVSYSLESLGEVTWQNPQNAFNQDLLDNASFSDFNEENSAFIQEKPKEESTTTTVPSETTPITESTTTTLPSEMTTTTTEQPITTTTESTTTTTIESTTTTTTLPPETTTTTTLPPEETTITTIPQETTTTEPISWLKKIFGFLIPKVNAEEESPVTNSFAAIIFDNFSLPEDFNLTQIQNAQLRISLAGQGQEGDKIIISYFYSASAEASADRQWQNLEELDLSQEISNNKNGGYFLFALPVFENWTDLGNLKIRFTYSGFQIPNSEFSEVYLDALWLEVEYKELIEETDNLPIINELDLSTDKIREIKSSSSRAVIVQIKKDDEDELWFFNLESGKIRKLGFRISAPAEDFPIGLKNNFVFWLNKNKDNVFAYDLVAKKFYQKSLPFFDPARGERARINFPEVLWEVIVDADNFYFFSGKTGEVFSDGNSEILESFRRKFNLDSFLTEEELSTLGFSMDENE